MARTKPELLQAPGQAVDHHVKGVLHTVDM
jgi:hypothetical protein